MPVRFGDEVIGGAEMLVRELAEGLAERGWAVDVLTGCARDHFGRAHWYPPGESELPYGARLVRFPSVTSRASRAPGARQPEPRPRRARSTVRAAYRWLNDDVRVPGLFEYLVDHGHEYRAIVAAPYLYWTTVATAVAAPDRTVLLPCLHDEPTAALPVYDAMFRDVARVLVPHRARSRLREEAVAGAHRARGGRGRGARARHYDPDGFRGALRRRRARSCCTPAVGSRARASIGSSSGSRRPRRTRPDPLRLVVAGPGPAPIPDEASPFVVDVGALSERDRDDAMAAARALVQPSPNESFSRTMMEAWLAGTFVLANGASAVSRWHCDRSGAGAVYGDEAGFAEWLRRLADPSWVAAERRRPRDVLREYTWPVVLDRVEATRSTSGSRSETRA